MNSYFLSKSLKKSFKMSRNFIALALYCICAFLTVSAELEGICSVKEPSADDVCVSIKLPWRREAVFFCTEKGSIDFEEECNHPIAASKCPQGANGSLVVGTPWDCCPFISHPNPCATVECPPRPFNRTCSEVKKPGDCCPTYFCEGNRTDCKLERMKNSSCVMSPRGRKCLGFRDPFGCCNKYQCLGEGKVGQCPEQIRPSTSSKLESILSGMTSLVDEAKHAITSAVSGVSTTLESHGGRLGKKLSGMIPQQLKKNNKMRRCTGDFHCPGIMKCCDSSPNTIWRNEESKMLIDGICQWPAITPPDFIFHPRSRSRGNRVIITPAPPIEDNEEYADYPEE